VKLLPEKVDKQRQPPILFLHEIVPRGTIEHMI